MYSGIVSGAYPVTQMKKQEGLLSFTVKVPAELLHELEVGASVSIDGVCLTVTHYDDSSMTFDVMQQTLATTTLANIVEGQLVNVERSLLQGAEVGGHLISGHVDGMATICDIQTPPNNFVLTIELPEPLMKYVFPKGFIAVNGTSLTIAEVNKALHTLTFYLIPETLRKTSFANKKIGDLLNVEVERNTQAIVDTIQDFLSAMVEDRQLSGEQLQKLSQSPNILLDHIKEDK